MAQIRVCDRCGASVAGPLTLEATTRNVVVPQADPSTNPVKSDGAFPIGIQTANDLCAACLLSALVEFALTALGPSLAPAVVAALSARINAVLAAEISAQAQG